MEGSGVMAYFSEMQMKVYTKYTFYYYRDINVFTIRYQGERNHYRIEDDMSLFGCGERKVMSAEERERFKEFRSVVLR